MQHLTRWMVRGVILCLCILTLGGIEGIAFPEHVWAQPEAFAIQTMTPQPDGSLVHEVKAGENLWAISIAYGVYIQDIQRLNKMPEDEDKIFIGQKLHIPTRMPTPVKNVPANIPTPGPTINPVVASAASDAATSTAVERMVKQAQPSPPSLSPVSTPAAAIPVTGRDPTQTIQTLLIIFALIGIALIALGLVMK